MIQIKRVIPKGILEPINLQSFITITHDAKYASNTIKKIKDIGLQSANLSHLKRVKKILNSSSVKILLGLSEQRQQLQEFITEMKDITQQINLQMIPVNPPLNKAQFKQWTQYWPMTLIQPEIVKDITHSEQQLNFIHQILYQQDEYTLFSKQNKKLLGKVGNCNKGTINHPVMQILQQWPHSKEFLQKKDTPENYYYLTGLSFLVKQKLCNMCAMALVHSRVERIYITQEISEQTQSIFYCKKLNHKIDILSIIIQKEPANQQFKG